MTYNAFVIGYYVCYRSITMERDDTTNLPQDFDYIRGIICASVIGGLELMVLISLVFAMMIDPGTTPRFISSEIANQLKFCQMCQLYKPERSHHCSRCKRCVLKMDHHCPWVNNCVGWRNMKSFLLLCSYGSLLGFATTVTTIVHISVDTSYVFSVAHIDVALQLIFVMVFGALVGVVMMSFVSNHYFLMFKNMTSLEYWRAKQRLNELLGITTDSFASRWCPMCTSNLDHTYNLGKWKNFKLVFGKNPLLWPIPIPTYTGDGIMWTEK
eukprot:TRINITY_DN1017_c0_g1_i1.p1 TRINITY_DN1017_c0_g1~~TRINITY_DN1017_c0_g1_i1.p1  ORF type:complete len:269 (+),score=56.84 TRINITY_DN1017_c0_g1_i1:468-1274(+)